MVVLAQSQSNKAPQKNGLVGVGVGVLYSNTTFIGDMGPPLQIRQVAHLVEHHMQETIRFREAVLFRLEDY